MSLRDTANEANIDNIVEFIKSSAEKGKYELDLNDYEFNIDITSEVRKKIKDSFDEDEITITNNNIVSW